MRLALREKGRLDRMRSTDRENGMTQGQQPTRSREDLRTTLYTYHASGTVPFVEIANAEDGSSCPACKALHGRRFTIEDAIARDILPCPECTRGSGDGARGLCRCKFLPVQEQRKRARESEAPSPSWIKRFFDI